jgi:uncharacterized membrane protein YecN with MAPEG domain
MDFSPEQTVAIATALVSLIAAAVLLALFLVLHRRRLVASPTGWLSLTLGIFLLAARVLHHFAEGTTLEVPLRAVGLLGAALIGAGLFLILRSSRGPRREAMPA